MRECNHNLIEFGRPDFVHSRLSSPNLVLYLSFAVLDTVQHVFACLGKGGRGLVALIRPR